MKIIIGFIIQDLENKNYEIILDDLFSNDNFEYYNYYQIEDDNKIKGNFIIEYKENNKDLSDYANSFLELLSIDNKLNFKLDYVTIIKQNKTDNKLSDKKDNIKFVNIETSLNNNSETKLDNSLTKKIKIKSNSKPSFKKTNNNSSNSLEINSKPDYKINYTEIKNKIINIKKKENIVKNLKEDYIQNLYTKYQNYNLDNLKKELEKEITYNQKIYLQFLVLKKEYESLNKSILSKKDFYKTFNNYSELKQHVLKESFETEDYKNILDEYHLYLEISDFKTKEEELEKIQELLNKPDIEYQDLKDYRDNICNGDDNKFYTDKANMSYKLKKILELFTEEKMNEYINELNEIKFIKKLESQLERFEKNKNNFEIQDLENLESQIDKNIGKEHLIHFNSSLYKNNCLKVYSTTKKQSYKYYNLELKEDLDTENFVIEVKNKYIKYINNNSSLKDYDYTNYYEKIESFTDDLKIILTEQYRLKNKNDFNYQYISKRVEKSIQDYSDFSNNFYKSLSDKEIKEMLDKLTNIILNKAELKELTNVKYNRKNNQNIAYNYVVNDDKVLEIFKNAKQTEYHFWKPSYESVHTIESSKALEYKCNNKKIIYIPRKFNKTEKSNIFKHSFKIIIDEDIFNKLFRTYLLKDFSLIIDNKGNKKIIEVPYNKNLKASKDEKILLPTHKDLEESNYKYYKGVYFKNGLFKDYQDLEVIKNQEIIVNLESSNGYIDYQEELSDAFKKELKTKLNKEKHYNFLNAICERMTFDPEIVKQLRETEIIKKEIIKKEIEQTGPESEKGRIYFQGFNPYEITALNQQLLLANEITEIIPNLDIETNKYNNFNISRKLNYAPNKMPIHGITSANNHEQIIKIFSNIIKLEGLHSISSRRNKSITYTGLSVLGDIASGIDRGVAFNYNVNAVHGSDIFFLAKPNIFEREEVCLAPEDFGGGHNRYPEFKGYLNKLEGNDLNADIFNPNLEARQKHLTNFTDTPDNEIYVTDNLSFKELDSIFISNLELYNKLEPIIQEAKDKKIIPQDLTIARSTEIFPTIEKYLHFRAFHYNLR